MKKYKILLQDKHEYDLVIQVTEKAKIISIYYSNVVELWTSIVRGKLAIQLKNTGDEIIISNVSITKSENLPKKLDFSQAMLLNFVLTLDAKTNYSTGEFKDLQDYEMYQVIEEKTLLTLI